MDICGIYRFVADGCPHSVLAIMADGNIVAALGKLSTAVDRLCKPRMAVYHNQTRYALSLFRQLEEDLAGTQGDTRTPAKSLPPLWIDAAQLRIDMESKTRQWCRKRRGIPERLWTLAGASWRPQDTDHVTDMAKTIDFWCETIIHLLDPEPVMNIRGAACPNCGRSFVYRKDSAGETVRISALKVITEIGCTCQACNTFWPPGQYMFLRRLLGMAAPEGVLE